MHRAVHLHLRRHLFHSIEDNRYQGAPRLHDKREKRRYPKGTPGVRSQPPLTTWNHRKPLALQGKPSRSFPTGSRRTPSWKPSEIREYQDASHAVPASDIVTHAEGIESETAEGALMDPSSVDGADAFFTDGTNNNEVPEFDGTLMCIHDESSPPGRQRVLFINEFFNKFKDNPPSGITGTFTQYPNFKDMPIELQVLWWNAFVAQGATLSSRQQIITFVQV
ncbi:MAG: hypothetical protein ACTSUE_01645 [Promethearchaeota archaeon]